MELKGLSFVRKTFGMTMKELGEKLNVSSTTINLWEKGTMQITQERLYELCNLFKLDNPQVLYHDFSKDDLETNDLIIQVEMGRLQYKIDKYNVSYAKHAGNKLGDKLEMMEENREIFEDLLEEVEQLVTNTSTEEFRILGVSIAALMSSLYDDGMKDYISTWFDAMTAYNVNIDGDGTDITNVEDYIKYEIHEKICILNRMKDRERIEEKERLDRISWYEKDLEESNLDLDD